MLLSVEKLASTELRGLGLSMGGVEGGGGGLASLGVSFEDTLESISPSLGGLTGGTGFFGAEEWFVLGVEVVVETPKLVAVLW